MNDFSLFWFFSFIIVIFTASITYGIYILLDMCGKSTTVVGRVIKKVYYPPRIYSWMNSRFFDKYNYPTDRRQRSWYLIVEVQNKRKKIRVSRDIFKAFEINDEVDINVSIGRLSKKLQIIDITPYQAINAQA